MRAAVCLFMCCVGQISWATGVPQQPKLLQPNGAEAQRAGRAFVKHILPVHSSVQERANMIEKKKMASKHRKTPLWIRVPLPDVHLKPVKGVPQKWWDKKVRLSRATKVHNVVWQPAMTDLTFYSDLLVTPGMKAKANSMNNGERRLAVTQCLVALKQLLYRHEHFIQTPVPFWMEGGTLLATDLGGRGGHYIPWDVDGDVALSLHDWYRVHEFLNKTTSQRTSVEGDGGLPVSNYKDCGCLLVDMDSFGSSRPSSIPGITGIPGRIFNECTGNWVDIFAVFNRTEAIAHKSANKVTKAKSAEGMLYNTLPQGSMTDGLLFSYKKEIVYPLQKCLFEGYEFECPAHTKKYLIIEEGKNVFVPDHKWSDKKDAFVITKGAVSDVVHSQVNRAQASMCHMAAKGMFPPSVVKSLNGCTKKQYALAKKNFHGFGG